MEKKLDDQELNWKKTFTQLNGSNKEKMLNLAEKQKTLLDKQYRQNQINKTKMEEKMRRQEKLEKLNKEAFRNAQVDMMEQNQIDPKIIEAARLRAEDSDDSESDDEVIIHKKKVKERTVKKKLNLSDNFFHGRPLIRKPPINPFSFNIYEQAEGEEPEQEIVVKKKKKKKKKKQIYPPYPFMHPQMSYPGMQFMPNGNNNGNGSGNGASNNNDNSDAIAELQRAMSMQNKLLGNMVDQFGKMKDQRNMKRMMHDEDLANMNLKFDEFDRHHNAVRGINTLKNDLDRASNDAGLARIRAGFAQEQMMDEFRKQIDEAKRTNFRNVGMRSLKNFHANPIIIDDTISDRRSRRKKKKKKKKRQPRRQPNQPLYDEQQIKKLTDKLVKEKLKEAMNSRAEPSNRIAPAYNQPPQKRDNSIINGPNGLTIIKPKGPNEQPMVIMPDKASTVYSKSSKKSRKNYNPMDDFMNKMLMMNMMNQMNKNEPKRNREPTYGDDEAILIPLIDDVSEKKSKKKKKKKKKKDRAGFEIEPPMDLDDQLDYPIENTRSTFDMGPIQSLQEAQAPLFDNEPIELDRPEPKPMTPPKSKKKSHLQTALKKVWKLWMIFKFLKIRDQILKAKLMIKYNTINNHFDKDSEDVTEKTLYMFKKRLEPISKQLIIEEDYDINIDINQESRDILQERIQWIMDELIDLSEMKSDRAFPHSIILSFLSSFTLPNCYIPNEELTQFEFERISFASTGMTKYDLPKEVTKMLIGGFILVKMLCFHLYFRTYEYSSEIELPKECKRYFKLIGLVIYTAYIELYFERLRPNPDNIEDITLITDVPDIRQDHLYYKLTDEGKDLPVDEEKNFVIGAPTIDDVDFLQDEGFLDEIKDQIDHFLENMYDQVQFQNENENLPRIQRLIDDREYIANRVEEIHPNYHHETQEWVKKTRIRLNLDEAATYR